MGTGPDSSESVLGGWSEEKKRGEEKSGNSKTSEWRVSVCWYVPTCADLQLPPFVFPPTRRTTDHSSLITLLSTPFSTIP